MSKIYVIAELGNTHDGSVGIAKQMIRVAADCGADAVKIQTHIFDAESLSNAPNPPYFNDESRKQYFDRTSFSRDQYLELIETAEIECGIEFLSSPFSVEAVDFLESIQMKRYKIPSGEVSNTPLLKKVAGTGKPTLLSSGMSSWKDLDLAVNILKSNGCVDLILLQCSSIYPCPSDKVGLNILKEITGRYSILAGYSDHTLGLAAPFAAATLGATVIEKHFTLSTNMYGSDAKHSMEPDDFKIMIKGIRQIESMVNNPVKKDLTVNVLDDMKRVFEKSVVSVVDIPACTIITADMISVKKPGTGIPARKYEDILGKKSAEMIPANQLIKISQLIGFDE